MLTILQQATVEYSLGGGMCRSAALDAPVKAVQKATQALRARRVLQTALKGRAILPSSEVGSLKDPASAVV